MPEVQRCASSPGLIIQKPALYIQKVTWKCSFPRKPWASRNEEGENI